MSDLATKLSLLLLLLSSIAIEVPSASVMNSAPPPVNPGTAQYFPVYKDTRLKEGEKTDVESMCDDILT
jgi:hypothetical protein